MEGVRPVSGQLFGLVQVTLTQVLPPAGHSLTLYETHGPPVGGGVMVMAAVVGLVGLADSEGGLQAGAGAGVCGEACDVYKYIFCGFHQELSALITCAPDSWHRHRQGICSR